MNAKLLNYITAIEQKTLATAALTAILLLATASLGLESFSSYTLANNSELSKQNPRTEKQTNSKNHSVDIVQAAFFGAISNSKLSNIKLPKTKQKLILRGAFTAADPEKASAIIEGADKQAKHYKVGNAIAGGSELRAVYNDRVVLATNQNLETLYFPSGISLDIDDSNSSKPSVSSEQDISEKRKELIKKRLEELRRRVKR